MSPPSPKPALGDDEPIDYVGRLVGGKYEVHQKVGDGGMGTVFEAHNVTVGKRVALKVLRPSFARQREALERFEREARAATRIGHPNIIDVLDMGLTEEGLPFLIMEMLEGEELYARLQRAAPFSPSFAIRVMEQVLGALEAAHGAGIVHRDLKPENIFIVDKGPSAGLVKILDFGVAKFQDGKETSPRITREGLLVGTPAYMSPEQAVAGGEIDHRSDIYSAGVLLYEMLSAELPHHGESYMQMAISIATKEPRRLSEVATWLDADLAAVIDKALARDPADRWQSAAEMMAALEPFRGDTSEGESVPSGRLAPRFGSGLRQRRSSSKRSQDALHQVTLAEEPEPSRVDVTQKIVRSSATATPEGGKWVIPATIAAVAIVAVVIFAVGQGGEGDGARATRATQAPDPEPEKAPPTKAAPTEPAPVAPPVPPPAPAPEPAPAAAASDTVTLDVAANVRHARVRLDGVLIGETPLHEIVPRRTGRHILTVDAVGFARVERIIELDADQRVEVILGRTPAENMQPPGKVPQPPGGQLIFDQDPYHRSEPAPAPAP